MGIGATRIQQRVATMSCNGNTERIRMIRKPQRERVGGGEGSGSSKRGEVGDVAAFGSPLEPSSPGSREADGIRTRYHPNGEST